MTIIERIERIVNANYVKKHYTKWKYMCDEWFYENSFLSEVLYGEFLYILDYIYDNRIKFTEYSKNNFYMLMYLILDLQYDNIEISVQTIKEYLA